MKLGIALSLALVAWTRGVAAGTFYSALEPCPLACEVSGHNPANWTHYYRADELKLCEKTALFDLGLYSDPDEWVTIRACTASESTSIRSPVVRREKIARQLPATRGTLSSNSTSDNSTSANSTAACGAPGVETKPVTADLQLALWGPKQNASSSAQIVTAAEQLAVYVEKESNCASTILLAQSGSAIVGVYVGSQVDKQSAVALLQAYIANAKTQAIPGRNGAEVCGNNTSSTQVFGVFSSAQGNLSDVQSTLRDWNDGKCLSGYDSRTSLGSGHSISLLPAVQKAPQPSAKRDLEARATCKYAQVATGDGCWATAQKCGIPQADLEKYNKRSDGKDFCTNLVANQYVCCSSGTLPDFSPQPNADGSCFAYTIKKDDVCGDIAAAHQTTADKIESLNKKTWGWTGCKFLQIDQKICLSSGDPPFPAPIPNAICGPQIAGTTKPTNGTKWEDLNPCPLNACCNVWGQCGTTPEFCTKAPADTGAPGTSKPGANGCLSSCSTDIINNSEGPAQFIKIGYFEAWNKNRKCLNMKVGAMTNKNFYTHVHFAFADITKDFNVDVSKVQDEFDGLKKLTGIKKIVSFGGWSFSTEMDTFPIFRDGVTNANRQAFVKNIVRFVSDNGLDGVDFDWEYPGAPDIEGIPAGSPQDGANYLAFLKMVRAALPKDKSVSIAAPASYWYLKGFPIKEISGVVDYIVYMTYDLHGQWDYKNKWVNEGCGNCARHHANETEVKLALSMVTKAGVPSKKLVVGLPLYGRSFKLDKAGCKGPSCTYAGPLSSAAKGECTDTAGYISNYEINKIIAAKNPVKYYDEGDIIIYDDNQYVSYLTADTYNKRADFAKSKNFGGQVDWATDLDIDKIGGDSGGDDEGNHGDGKWHGAIPDGEYFPARGAGWPGTEDTTHVTYATLVNGSPYDFKLTRLDKYQLDANFDTVVAGAARQNKQDYRPSGTFTDKKAEAYYKMEGTSHDFSILSRTRYESFRDLRTIWSFDHLGTKDVAQGSAPELEERGGYRAYNLVVTGSEKYGYWTSQNPPVAWMSAILDVIGKRKLKHVSMIGSHDAGMSKYNGGTAFTSSYNCNNQRFNLADQLRFGSRFFDIRPVVGNGGQYLAGHYNLPSKTVMGCNGESLDDIVKEINSFTDSNPELVILHLSHAYNTDDGYRAMNTQEWDKTFTILEGLHNRCGGFEGDLTDKTMNDFIGKGKACVIVVADGGTARPDKGIYNTGEQFDWQGEGHWSETDEPKFLGDDQTSHMQAHKKVVEGDAGDRFYVLQWITTLKGISNADPGDENGNNVSHSIEIYATRMAYDTLFWKAWNAMSPTCYPNVMLLDYVGDLQDGEDLINMVGGGELIALAMAVNLAIASKNSYVGGGTIY